MVGATAGTVAITQGARRTDLPSIAVAQALTPLLAAGGVPASAVGVWQRRFGLAGLSAASSIALARVVAPAARSGRAPVGGGPAALTVAHANMLFSNQRHAREAAAALLACDADVLALSELTYRHERELKALDGDGRYAYRFPRPARDSHGLAIWSRLPFDDLRIEPMTRRPGMVVEVATDAGPIRIVLAHPDPPMKRRWLRFWAPSLEHLDRLGRSPGPPTLIVADLNAARWHPPLRRLLDDGWRDAHESVGRGLSPSWPTLGLVPPFVRLDHALVDERLDVIAVDDIRVPGSDHRGFVVAVSPRAAQA